MSVQPDIGFESGIKRVSGVAPTQGATAAMTARAALLDGSNTGDLFFNTDTNSLYVWTGYEYALLDGTSCVIATHTSSAAGSTFPLFATKGTVQATNDFNGGSGLTAVITIQVSNDADQWLTLGTISLSGDNDSDGFAFDAPWRYIRSNATTFTPTGSTPQTVVTVSL